MILHWSVTLDKNSYFSYVFFIFYFEIIMNTTTHGLQIWIFKKELSVNSSASMYEVILTPGFIGVNEKITVYRFTLLIRLFLNVK